MKRFLYIMVLASAVGAGAAVDYDFARYQEILARKPFGGAAWDAAAAAAAVKVVPPAPEEPPFTKDIRMCGITDSPGGIRVGFLDISQKPPKSHFLRIGEETEDGIAVLDADYDEEKALLAKGEQEHWIYMNQASGGVEPSAVNMVSAAGKVPLPSSRAARARAAANAAGGSYAERLKQRRAEIMKRRLEMSEEKTKISPEDMRKHLEEVQMDAIRKGLPPLPIPLTPEMDDQLVKEGLLPPSNSAE